MTSEATAGIIGGFVAGELGNSESLTAKNWRAFPQNSREYLVVFADMGGACLLHVSGRFLGVGHRDGEEIELSERWLKTAHREFVLRYPELADRLGNADEEWAALVSSTRQSLVADDGL